jgi:hypothetical protein
MPAVKVCKDGGKKAEIRYELEEYKPNMIGIAPSLPGAEKRSNSKSIRSLLNKIHQEYCPQVLLTVFKQYWPDITKITMKEAWLRIVFLEALSGQPWATQFIANRTEGAVETSGLAEDRGTILSAIDKDVNNPVPTECEIVE